MNSNVCFSFTDTDKRLLGEYTYYIEICLVVKGM
jgi:hypothetical protein